MRMALDNLAALVESDSGPASSYEDLLGLRRGGDDGHGHLGFAAAAGLRPFGPDVFGAFRGRGPQDGA